MNSLGRWADRARQLGISEKAVLGNLDSRQALTGPRVAWPGAAALLVFDKSDLTASCGIKGAS